MKVVQFVDEGLGNSAHLLVSEDAGVAAVIDPLRDVDQYLDAARALGVRITHVFETHLHNDFVSGGRELAAHGAQLCAGVEAGLGFDHLPLRDGQEVAVGDLRVAVMATPGHTPEHLAYLARDARNPDQPPVLFSGGSLLVGGVARTDLLGPDKTEGLSRLLFQTLHRKILPLDDAVQVFPTHGGGSFCTSAPGGARSTTLGRERRENPLLRIENAGDFQAAALRGLGTYPEYFSEMRPINQKGPPVLGQLPVLQPLAPQEVHRRLDAGDALLDIRPALDYARSHIPDSYHSEYRDGFASWAGWVVPFGTPLILVPGDASLLAGAVRGLIRIGFDCLSGYLEGGVPAWESAGLPIARFPIMTVGALRQLLEEGQAPDVLDVRQDAEWEAGHIPGARHQEAGSLARRDPGIPREAPLAVHCGHAPRAATALSVLERLGYRDLRLIDGGFGAWERAGFPVERTAAIPQ